VIDRDRLHPQPRSIFKGGQRLDSLKKLLAKTLTRLCRFRRPRGRELEIPRPARSISHIHIGIDWLSIVSSPHRQDRQARDRATAAATPRWIAAAPRPPGGDDVSDRAFGFEDLGVALGERRTHSQNIRSSSSWLPVAFTHDNASHRVPFQKVKAESTPMAAQPGAVG